MTRPAFGGNTIATIACPDNRPQMATVRPGVMQKIEPIAEQKQKLLSTILDLHQTTNMLRFLTSLRIFLTQLTSWMLRSLYLVDVELEAQRTSNASGSR